jgi:uncharacterized membrane protein YccC
MPKAFFQGVPPRRDWFYGLRTFAAAMIALYIALIMQLDRPYWAMASVYLVSSPFVAPTSSKALYRAAGTFFGAAASVLVVPVFVQTPFLLAIVVALWTGTLLFLSLHLRTANSYALMLAGYTMPLIAFPVVDNPLAVFDIAVARTEEIFVGIVCAAVVGAMFWPRRLAPVMIGAIDKWFKDASTYSDLYLARNAEPEVVAVLRTAMVSTFNSLELMIGQLPHEGVHRQTVRNAKELRGRMVHLLPVMDALDEAVWALERRTPELQADFAPLMIQCRTWVDHTAKEASRECWQILHDELHRLKPTATQLDDRSHLLLSNALYRLGEFIDLWQDCRTLQRAIETDDHGAWHAVYRHWRLSHLTPFLDKGMMLYSVATAVSAIIVASGIWILLGWQDGASAIGLAAVSCSFFAALDDPAPQMYRHFFWTFMSVIFASLYLFVVLPNLHDFPMLVLAFAIPFICMGALAAQPKFYLSTLLIAFNTSSFISIQSAYDADFLNFLNSNFAGPAGLAFAFVWTLLVRPFGTEVATKRMTRFSWCDIVSLSEDATLATHREMGVRMVDRLMQHLPRLTAVGQDTNVALREVRVALNMLDLLAYMPRVNSESRQLLSQIIRDVGAYFRACLRSHQRLSAPKGLLMTMDRARRSLTLGECPDLDSRLHLLHALSGLRLALLPGVEIVDVFPEQEGQMRYGADGAPL